MRMAFLGLGRMGSAIAHHLLKTGYDLTVWNRTEAAARLLEQAGARIAPDPAACVTGAAVVFTMLFGDDALRAVLLAEPVLQALQPGAVHVSLSTISLELARQLEQEHASRGQRFLGCPVFGRPNIAEQGRLWLAAGGDDAMINELAPVLSTFSRGMTVVGPRPSQAHAVKLAGNFLITAAIASMSEGITVTGSLGVEPAVYLEVINSAVFQSPFYENYGRVMLHPPKEVAATMTLGQKDTRLFQESAREGQVPVPLAETFQAQFARAIARGAGDEDWAAGYLNQTRVQAAASGGGK